MKGGVDGASLTRAMRYAVERQRAERRLTRLALRDALTGLPNRVLLADRLEQALARLARAQGEPGTEPATGLLVLMFLDLDGFKAVNDTLGPPRGRRRPRGGRPPARGGAARGPTPSPASAGTSSPCCARTSPARTPPWRSPRAWRDALAQPYGARRRHGRDQRRDRRGRRAPGRRGRDRPAAPSRRGHVRRQAQRARALRAGGGRDAGRPGVGSRGMADVVMPRLSDTMEEGTILRWLKAEGEAVAAGDELVEIETDKANMSYEAEAEGVLSVVADVGATLAVGAVIARLGGGGGRARGLDRLRPESRAPVQKPARGRARRWRVRGQRRRARVAGGAADGATSSASTLRERDRERPRRGGSSRRTCERRRRGRRGGPPRRGLRRARFAPAPGAPAAALRRRAGRLRHREGRRRAGRADPAAADDRAAHGGGQGDSVPTSY